MFNLWESKVRKPFSLFQSFSWRRLCISWACCRWTPSWSWRDPWSFYRPAAPSLSSSIPLFLLQWFISVLIELAQGFVTVNNEVIKRYIYGQDSQPDRISFYFIQKPLKMWAKIQILLHISYKFIPFFSTPPRGPCQRKNHQNESIKSPNYYSCLTPILR